VKQDYTCYSEDDSNSLFSSAPIYLVCGNKFSDRFKGSMCYSGLGFLLSTGKIPIQ